MPHRDGQSILLSVHPCLNTSAFPYNPVIFIVACLARFQALLVLVQEVVRDFYGQRTPEDSVTTDVCLLQGKETVPVAGGARGKALILRDSTGHYTSHLLVYLDLENCQIFDVNQDMHKYFPVQGLDFGIDLKAGPKVHRISSCQGSGTDAF